MQVMLRWDEIVRDRSEWSECRYIECVETHEVRLGTGGEVAGYDSVDFEVAIAWSTIALISSRMASRSCSFWGIGGYQCRSLYVRQGEVYLCQSHAHLELSQFDPS